jgi:hypothetical protein
MDAILRLTPIAATESELRSMEQTLDAAGEQIQKMHRR